MHLRSFLAPAGMALAVLALHVACGAEPTTPRSHVPDRLPPPAAIDTDFAVDPELGVLASRTRLLVALAPGLASDDIDAVVALAGPDAVLAGGAPELDTLLVTIPGGADHDAAHRARDALAGDRRVAAVVLDTALGPTVLPEGSSVPIAGVDLNGGGGDFSWQWGKDPEHANWGLTWANFPAAWNFDDAIEKQHRTINVGEVDGGPVQDTHPELAGVVTRVTTVVPPAALPAPIGHATHVAGIIGASFFDKTGINGAAPFARVLAIDPPFDVNGLASIGDVILSNFRQLMHHAGGIRAVNLSLGFNWLRNQNPTKNAAGEIIGLPVPVAENPGQQKIVEATGLIAARQAAYLASLPEPVMIVAAAGNDGLAASRLAAGLDQATEHNAHGWLKPDARWSSPYCYAALELGAENILCVEALAQTADRNDVRRTDFSNVGGTLAAPGELIGSTYTCAGACVGVSGYARLSGTSMAAPMVAGLVAHMLAFQPDTSIAELRAALLDSARTPGADTAPGIDAFAAMMRLPDAKRALFDVDDGTVDGSDLDDEADLRGDGALDMSDFRRVRDALLWVSGDRAQLTGAAQATKLDLNRDGVLDDAHPEVHPREDFDGDGALSAADVAVMAKLTADDGWADRDAAASDLPLLATSGDLHLDVSQFFAKGATSVTLEAAGAPYAITIKAGETRVYSVPAGHVVLTGTVAGANLAVDDAILELAAGQDIDLVLTPDDPSHPVCNVTLGTEDAGIQEDIYNYPPRTSDVTCKLGAGTYVIDPESLKGCMSVQRCTNYCRGWTDPGVWGFGIGWTTFDADGNDTGSNYCGNPGFGGTCESALAWTKRACAENYCQGSSPGDGFECSACNCPCGGGNCYPWRGPGTIVFEGFQSRECKPGSDPFVCDGAAQWSGSLSFKIVNCASVHNALPNCPQSP